MTVELNRITTRAGDRGRTNLASGPRVPKDHANVEALGAVDELNAQVGIALAQPGVPEHHRPILAQVQQRLFDLGADLAHPDGAIGGPVVGDDQVRQLEAVITPLTEALPPLTSFVLPGGGLYAAHLHACRTACRTAERRVVAIGTAAGRVEDEPRPQEAALRYLNRLSDLFFVLAREASAGDEVVWEPLEG